MQFLVRRATWPDAPGDAVFPADSVRITNSAIRESLLYEMRKPLCLISEAGGTSHEENPLLVKAAVAVTVAVEHWGDAWGSAALVGANRATTAGASLHRGLLEVYRPVVEDVVKVGRETGVGLVLAGERDAGPVKVKDDLVLLAKEFTLGAWVFEDAGEYPAVRTLTATPAGGSVTVAWTPPPARWDLPAGATSVVRKVGSAPTAITDGTLVADGSTAGSLVDAPGPGTFFYGAAAKFDELAGTRFSTTLKTAGPVVVV